MKSLVIAIVLLCANPSYGDDASSKIKSWKNFASSTGYELKYPDCWELKINDPDQNGPIEKAQDIFVKETSKCARPRHDPEIPNGVSLSSWGTFESKEEIDKGLVRKEKWVRSGTHANHGFKKHKLGGSDAITYVEILPYNRIRWQTVLYCPSLRSHNIQGPSIKDPSPSMVSKIKKGDLARPEPEETLVQSIRCTNLKPPSHK